MRKNPSSASPRRTVTETTDRNELAPVIRIGVTWWPRMYRQAEEPVISIADVPGGRRAHRQRLGDVLRRGAETTDRSELAPVISIGVTWWPRMYRQAEEPVIGIADVRHRREVGRITTPIDTVGVRRSDLTFNPFQPTARKAVDVPAGCTGRSSAAGTSCRRTVTAGASWQ